MSATAHDTGARRLAVITARGGSVRVPRKNIRSFLGRPIIAYPIEAARESALFDAIIVSTDDAEIAAIAEAYGASVPFLRSAATADAFATTADVLHEVLDRLAERGETFDECCCLYPTAAMVDARLLHAAHRLLVEGARDAVVPLVPFPSPIERALRIDESGAPVEVFPGHARTRSQDLEPRYHDAGQFYWFTVAPFRRRATLLSENSAALVCDALEVHDIDTEEDWTLAELKYRGARIGYARL